MRGNPDNLRHAAGRKSAAAKARAEQGLEKMIRRGDPITFRGLARTAGVSLGFDSAARDIAALEHARTVRQPTEGDRFTMTLDGRTYYMARTDVARVCPTSSPQPTKPPATAVAPTK